VWLCPAARKVYRACERRQVQPTVGPRTPNAPLGLGSSPIRRRRPDCLAARADRTTCRVDCIARYSEALVNDDGAVAESPTGDRTRRSAYAVELAAHRVHCAWRAHPVKPRYQRAREGPWPPVRASRWPRRAGVSRGGHRWRARRACEPDSVPTQTRVADRSDQVRRTQTAATKEHHRGARHGAVM
jgi:hypothetical protein